MTFKSLDRRLAPLAAVFAFLGVALGVFALTLNYWTYKDSDNELPNDTNTNDTQSNSYGWKGLFKECESDGACVDNFLARIFIVCLLGIVSLLVGGIFSVVDIPKITNRRLITPLLIFVGCVLMTVGLADYGSIDLLNYHCSRAMMGAIIFACAALSISGFVAGQYSALEQRVLINNETHDVQKYPITNGNGL